MLTNRVTCRGGERCRWTSVAEVLACVAQHSAIRLEAIAERLFEAARTVRGCHASTTFDSFLRWFRKAVSPNTDGFRLPADLVGPFCVATGDTSLIEFIALEAGGVFVKLPTSTESAHGDSLRAHLAAVKEFGESADELGRILGDGRITDDEAARFEREVDEAVQRLLELKPLVRQQVTAEAVLA